MSTLCDICMDPGRCCKEFTLFENTNKQATFWIGSPNSVEVMLEKQRLPFIPTLNKTYIDKVSGKKYVTYLYSCTKLTDEGRCSIYESRPYACRSLIPGGKSPLCMYSSVRKRRGSC